jgi:hypothetical protein
VFGVDSFDKNPLQKVIYPILKGMPLLKISNVESITNRAFWFKSDGARITHPRIRQLTIASLSLFLLSALVLWVKPFNRTLYEFRNVFVEIKFCRKRDFEENPSNSCKADIRTFTIDDLKIYLSFESKEHLEGLPEIKLPWLRN